MDDREDSNGSDGSDILDPFGQSALGDNDHTNPFDESVNGDNDQPHIDRPTLSRTDPEPHSQPRIDSKDKSPDIVVEPAKQSIDLKQPVQDEVSAPITKGNPVQPLDKDIVQEDLIEIDSIFGDNDQLATGAIDVHFERQANYGEETSSIYHPNQEAEVLEPQGNNAQINIKQPEVETSVNKNSSIQPSNIGSVKQKVNQQKLEKPDNQTSSPLKDQFDNLKGVKQLAKLYEQPSQGKEVAEVSKVEDRTNDDKSPRKSDQITESMMNSPAPAQARPPSIDSDGKTQAQTKPGASAISSSNYQHQDTDVTPRISLPATNSSPPSKLMSESKHDDNDLSGFTEPREFQGDISQIDTERSNNNESPRQSNIDKARFSPKKPTARVKGEYDDIDPDKKVVAKRKRI